MKSRSFTSIPASTVITLCEKTLADIKAERCKREATFIECQRRRKWVFFGRLETSGETRSRIEGTMDGIGDVPSWYGWGSEEVAEKLLALAKRFPDQNIQVTADDFRHIR